MDESTFYEPPEKKVRNLRILSQNTKFTQPLIKIRTLLLKVSNNAVNLTYVEIREVRKKFIVINEQKAYFSSVDCKISSEISKMLLNLKKSHPELCSKHRYLRSGSYHLRSMSQALQPESTFEEPKDINNSQRIIPAIQGTQERVKPTYATISTQPETDHTLQQNKILASKNSPHIDNSSNDEQPPVEEELNERIKQILKHAEAFEKELDRIVGFA